MLRLDEVAVGEIDPAKATDYAELVLMFNVYDTLVFQAGRRRRRSAARRSGRPTARPTRSSSRDVKFQSGNPLTADDVVFSLDRMMAMGQGLSNLFANVEKVEAVDPTR